MTYRVSLNSYESRHNLYIGFFDNDSLSKIDRGGDVKGTFFTFFRSHKNKCT